MTRYDFSLLTEDEVRRIAPSLLGLERAIKRRDAAEAGYQRAKDALNRAISEAKDIVTERVSAPDES